NRLKTTVTVLENMREFSSDLPDCMKPESIATVAICPIERFFYPEDMDKLITDLQTTNSITAIFLVSELECVEQYCNDNDVLFVKRPEGLLPEKATLEDVLKYTLNEIENKGIHPALIMYANYLFTQRPQGLFDDLVNDIQYKGFDTVFPATEDYDNFWRKDENGNFCMIGNLLPHKRKEPMYRAVNGLGTVTHSSFIRKGKLVGDSVGIVVLNDEYRKKQPMSIDAEVIQSII
ncbi:MAG: hypothetical protein MI922_18645, partial [Bacteroidales bacterium]|nr:hypothetical protein [Bacteroidales bacterium]